MAQAKRGIWTILFLALAVLTVRETAEAERTSASILGFRITLTDVYYNAVADETTFTYKVESTPAAGKGLSHFVIAFCLDEDAIVASSHSPIEVGRDPTTGLVGIKFDEFEMEPEERSRTVWFTLKGEWTTDDIEIAGKAARDTAQGTITGPSCQPVACRITYSVERNRIDLRVLRPGTYASKLSTITLSGTGGAKVVFHAFDHPQYLTNGSSPPIEVAYSLGRALGDADDYGWYAADQFNGTELEISKQQLEGGVQITLWVRYVVRSSSYSSDYEADGTISVVPICV